MFMKEWIYIDGKTPQQLVNEKLVEENKNLLITINHDEHTHIGYISDGDWYVWIDNRLTGFGHFSINNIVRSENFGVIAYMELPKHAKFKK